MKRIFTVASIFILIIGSVSNGHPQTGTAPTVTFNIPLQLNDLHMDVHTVEVAVFIYPSQNDPQAVANGAFTLNVPQNGDINQTAQVVATQREGKDITRGTWYRAFFTLIVGGASQTPSQDAATAVQYRAKAGTPFTETVNGSISW